MNKSRTAPRVIKRDPPRCQCGIMLRFGRGYILTHGVMRLVCYVCEEDERMSDPSYPAPED